MGDIVLPVDFKARLHESIIESVGRLLTDEQLSEMVDASIKAFFTDTTPMTLAVVTGVSSRTDQWRIETQVSAFQQLVWAQVRTRANEFLGEYMSTGGGARAIHEFLTAFTAVEPVEGHVRSSMETLMLAMAGQMFFNTALAAAASTREAVGTSLYQTGYADIANVLRATPMPSTPRPETGI